MTTLTKTLLGLSIVSFAVGFGTDWAWGVGKPAGAIFFGLFMISKILEKEVAGFDNEQTKALTRADNLNSASAPSRRIEHTGHVRATA